MSNITKENVLECLKLLVEDCETFENWDTNDEDNWCNMVDNLIAIQKYIENT